MRRRGNIWVWLIGMPIIFWAIAHWGFYYYVKTKLDEAVLQAAPQADIRYSELETSLSGKITVRGIHIVPVGTGQGISIQSVHVQGPDALSYLMRHIPQLGDSGPPDKINVVVKGVEVDISGNRAGKLDRFSESAGYRKVDGKPRDICEVGSGASFTQLQELGFDRLQGEMKMGYQYFPGSRKLYMDFDMDVKGMQQLSLSMTLDNVPALDPQKMLGVLLSNLKLEYVYSSRFGQKVVEYCAQKRGVTPDDFKLLMADDTLRQLEKNGLVLGFGLKHALKSFLNNWGTLLVELSPPRPVGFFELAQLPRDQVAEKLGLQLAVNDALVTDLSFRILEGMSLIRRNNAADRKTRKLPPKVEYVWEYRKVPVGQLSAYLDHLVVIRDRDGVVHKGILSEVSNGRISILKRISGGKFTAHLVRSNVVSAQARVRVKVEQPKSAPPQTVPEKADAGNAQAAAEQGQQAGG